MQDEYGIDEYRLFYGSSKKHPNVMRFEIRWEDDIDGDILKGAVEQTMRRYPYLRVMVASRGNEYFFLANGREVVVHHGEELLEINAEKTNFHQLYFSYSGDILTVNIFHALTDGDGAYALMRTLIYYYALKRYGVSLSREDIRLVGDEIGAEEIENPLERLSPSKPSRRALSPVYTIDEGDYDPHYFHMAIEEGALIRKTKEIETTPNALFSLLLSRAIYRNYALTDQRVRIVVAVNERKALGAPRAHQSLVGGAFLEYGPETHEQSVMESARMFRSFLKEQTTKEAILNGVFSKMALSELIKSQKDDASRRSIVGEIIGNASRVMTATVSYVGKADFGDAEKYIKDFKTLVPPSSAVLVELSAVNG